MFSKAIEKMGTYSFIGLKTLKSLKSMCFFFFFFWDELLWHKVGIRCHYIRNNN
jgi:hypothetical protein